MSIQPNTIYNEDCLETMKRMPDNFVDLVLTDPPYKTISGGNKTPKWISGYGNSVLHKNDGKIFDHNSITADQWAKEVYRVLKDNSHCYIMSNYLNLFKTHKAFTDAGFRGHNLLVWEKNTANANRWYMKNCEYTLFFYKGKAKSINNASTKTVHKYKNIIGDKKHPTEKPVELMALYISNSTNNGETVYDPFMGSGTTAVACQNLNRNFIGSEISKEYCDIAEQRLRQGVLL